MKFIIGKKKSKTRKFVIKTSDYGVVLLLNFIKDAISSIKAEISSNLNPDELKDLIEEKYVLMDIAHQFGITIYDEEIKLKKSLTLELKETLKRNKEYESTCHKLDLSKCATSDISNDSIEPGKDLNEENQASLTRVNDDEVF